MLVELAAVLVVVVATVVVVDVVIESCLNRSNNEFPNLACSIFPEVGISLGKISLL